MNEIAAVQAALSSLKAATDIVQILKASTTSLKDAEAKFKLAELLSALADAKVELAQVQETIVQKDRMIRELNDQLAFKANMKFDAPYYWNVAEGGDRDGPFCQPCWDEKKLAVRLYGGASDDGHWVCKVCNKQFRDSSYVPPDRPAPRRNWVTSRRG